MDLDDAIAGIATRLRKADAAQIEAAYRQVDAWRQEGNKGDLAAALQDAGVIDKELAKKLRVAAVEQAGPKIAGYKLLEPLGGGGMGIVYAARHEALDRLVALKVLRPEALGDEDARRRFVREARAVGKLDHANIVRAYDVHLGDPDDPENTPPYIAMEFIRGETLHRLLQRKPRLTEKHVLQIGSAIANALDHAYRHGLVHRDVKPDNIMLTPKGQVKLCDLGLAKQVDPGQTLTQLGMTHGTPHFMSPEQARGRRDTDIRSDLYSLGCTLFRAAVGRAPYVADSAVELLLAHVEKPIPSPKALRPDLSIGFDRVIQRLLAKKRENRYQAPAHLRADLELLLAGEEPRLDYGVPYRAPRGESQALAPLPSDEDLLASLPSISDTGSEDVGLSLAEETLPPLDFLDEDELRAEAASAAASQRSPRSPSGRTATSKKKRRRKKTRPPQQPIAEPQGVGGVVRELLRDLRSRARNATPIQRLGAVGVLVAAIGVGVFFSGLIGGGSDDNGEPTDTRAVSETGDDTRGTDTDGGTDTGANPPPVDERAKREALLEAAINAEEAWRDDVSDAANDAQPLHRSRWGDGE